MRAWWVPAVCLAIGTTWLSIAGAQAVSPVPPFDRTVLHAQVILDRLGFSSGVVDGRVGANFRAALRGFQEVRGLEESGELDRPTLQALNRYRALRPTITVTVGTADAAGPFRPIPDDEAAQARLESMPYESLVERLAERFHTTRETLVALNPPGTRIGAGTRLVVPGVLPGSRAYASDDAAWNATLSSLNIDARQPQAALVTVDKSDGLLRVYGEGDRLIAQFPATMGSSRDPLPIGNWTIQGVARNPDWQFTPTLLRGVSDSERERRIPPGPNNPVGIVWLDLSKEHYGIHGTNEPAQIGRAESNGCVRLTNWDAAKLSLMVRPGTPARFVF